MAEIPSTRTLTEDDFIWAAAELGCEVAAIKAVCQVEAPKGGFLPSGKLTILFERHKFHKYTGGRYSIGANVSFSWPTPGGYLGGEREWERLEKAAKLDPHAAMLSASYGKFQIMGFSFAPCGYPSAGAMVADFQKGERQQLEGFVEFVKHGGLEDELQRKDWAGFARGYNGKDFSKNAYDVKLAAAYKSFKG